MLALLRPAVVMLACFTVLTGIIYPLAVTGAAQILLPHQAGGSFIVRNGRNLGSTLIGQRFRSDRYFHGRPSATSVADPNDAAKTVYAPYNAANSGGSNFGPTSKALMDRVRGDVRILREAGARSIPPDAVTASASGLDPHISPAYAALQVARVAKARNLHPDQVMTLLQAHTELPFLGLIGEPRVNVLRLNLVLDAELAPGT